MKFISCILLVWPFLFPLNVIAADSMASSICPDYQIAKIVKSRDGVTYMTDTNNHKVLTSSSLFTGTKIFAGTGTCGYSGDGGQATNAQLSYPSDVFLGKYAVYIVEECGNDYRIRKVDLDTNIITTVFVPTTPQSDLESHATVRKPISRIFFPRKQLGGYRPFWLKTATIRCNNQIDCWNAGVKNNFEIIPWLCQFESYIEHALSYDENAKREPYPLRNVQGDLSNIRRELRLWMGDEALSDYWRTEMEDATRQAIERS